jgi:ankyrin repeat protein
VYAHGGTALQSAAAGGYAELVLLLLDAGADPHQRDAEDCDALLTAAQAGHVGVCRALLQRARPDTGYVCRDGWNLLAAASSSGSVELMRALLDEYAVPVARPAPPAVPAAAGAGAGAGADVWQPPLCVAARHGHTDVCRALLDAGADVNDADACGDSVLMYAAEIGFDDLCALLLERGATVDACNHNGVTALGCAAQAGHDSVCRALLDAGASAQPGSSPTFVPLLGAARAGHEAVCALLIERGAPVNPPDDKTYAPLYGAAQGGHADVCRQLLERGAHVDGNVPHATPLCYAAENGHVGAHGRGCVCARTHAAS